MSLFSATVAVFGDQIGAEIGDYSLQSGLWTGYNDETSVLLNVLLLIGVFLRYNIVT